MNILTCLRFTVLTTILISSCTLSYALVTSSAPTKSISNGLVGYWTFDGKYLNTSTSTDSSGQGNHGAVINGVTPVLGKSGQAVSLNGSNQYIQVPLASSLNVSTNFSIAAWVKISTNKDYNQILMRNNANSDFYGLITDVNGSLVLQAGGSGVFCEPFSTTRMSTGVWYHVVGTYDATLGSANCKLYINGIQDVTTDTFTGGVGSGINSQDLSIGYDLPNGRPFAGALDDVRLYNRTLSASEITALAGVKASLNKSPTLNKGSSLTTSLTGWWTFDGNKLASATTSDSSGKANDGLFVNSPKMTQGKTGQAMTLNGTNQYATLASGGSNLSGTGSHTISAWAKVAALPSNGSSAWIFSKGSDASGSGWGMGLSLDTTANVTTWGAKVVTTSAGTTQYNAIGGTPVVGKWTHVTGVFDNTAKTIKLYVNGALVTTTATQSTLRHANNSYIGAFNNGGSFIFPLNGAVDDVRIYQRAFSASEVRNLYLLNSTSASYGLVATSTKPLSSSSLIAELTFDGKSMTSSTSTDSSGQGNDGTLTNSPTVTLGKLGQALLFNGTNQYVALTTGSGLSGTGSHTISAWVKLAAIPSSGQFAQIVTKGSDISGSGWGMMTYALNTGGSAVVWGTSIVTTNPSEVEYDALGPAPVVGKWTHVVGVFDNTNATLKLYVDGSLSQTVSTGTTLRYAGGSYIGAFNTSGSFGSYLTGSLDDIKVYNRALSAGEVKILYTMGAK